MPREARVPPGPSQWRLGQRPERSHRRQGRARARGEWEERRLFFDWRGAIESKRKKLPRVDERRPWCERRRGTFSLPTSLPLSSLFSRILSPAEAGARRANFVLVALFREERAGAGEREGFSDAFFLLIRAAARREGKGDRRAKEKEGPTCKETRDAIALLSSRVLSFSASTPPRWCWRRAFSPPATADG